MSDLDRMDGGGRLPPATPEPEDFTPNSPAIQRHYPFSQDFLQISRYEQEAHLQSLWKKYVDVMHSLGSRVSAAPLYDHFASVRHNPSIVKEVDNGIFNPLQLLAPVMFGSDVIGGYERVSEFLESWFTEYWVEKLVATVSLITKISSGAFMSGFFPTSPPEEAVEAVKKLNEEAQNESDAFYSFHQKVESAIMSTPDVMEVPDREMERAREVMMAGASLIHDLNNINMIVLGASELAKLSLMRGNTQEALEKILSMIGIFKYDDSTSAANLATRLLSPRGRDYNVSIDSSSEFNIVLPNHMRFAYFRSIYELLLNSIKYRDPNKPVRTASISQFTRGDNFVTTIEDNGSGIEDVERALKPGTRFHQNLAAGTGMGLASVSGLAQQNGWTFYIQSTPGVGTKATIEMSMEQLLLAGLNPTGRMFNFGTLMRGSFGASPLPLPNSSFVIPPSMAIAKPWLH